MALVTIISIAACNKDLPLPKVTGERKLVLLGEFVAGDTFLLRAGQSTAVGGSSTVSLNKLNDISITMQDSAGIVYGMNGAEDDRTQYLYTIPFSVNKPVMHGGTYTVTATHPSLGTSTAVVRIPEPIAAVVVDTHSVKYASDQTLQIKVRINDPGNTVNYYVIEAVKQLMDVQGYFFYEDSWHSMFMEPELYELAKQMGNLQTQYDTTYSNDYVRQFIYTSDVNSENAIDNGSLTRSKRVLLKDATFNGAEHEVNVFVAYGSVNDLAMGYQKGRTILYIKSVPEPYFKFLKAYEVYTPNSGFTTTEQPVKIVGNVQNGLGMVGGVSQVTYTYLNDEWNF